MKDWGRIIDTLQGMISGGSLGFIMGMWFCRRVWLGHYGRLVRERLEEIEQQKRALDMLCERITESIEVNESMKEGGPT